MSTDLLLIHPDSAVSRQLRDASRKLGARMACFKTGKDGLASFARARFDAVVCAPRMSDIDVWRLSRMIRSGRFGFAELPIVVACEMRETPLLEPLIENDLLLIPLTGDSESYAANLIRLVLERPKPKVLLVEDDEDAANAALRALEKYFAVEVAIDGPTALDAWRKHRHDLVLLDLMLPGMTGEEVQAEMLREKPTQAIVILTAFDDPQRCETLMLKGATDFIGKATSMSLLAAHCLRVLRQTRYISAAESALEKHDRLDRVCARVRIADLRLAKGQPSEASNQLRHAIALGENGDLSDDTWAQMLKELS